ncbi:LysR family transcriptional regulator [Rodentibacter caecimuris]|uniref:LysR family transcriptional regulator n=1 Tax=Rodentibacter caecimuris TaxID=1796644 RepID=UPI00098547F4|nr:LysR family transcriptional regulator [Rodentibacter heylii]
MKIHSDELAVFVQVVESGSFSRAAEHLAMANSVVSRTVKKLEDKLAVNLLNRTTRQLSLTEEGHRFFARAQKILQEMAVAEMEMLSANSVPQGALRIDSASPMLLHLIAPHIAEFKQRYPQIDVSLVSSEGYINLIERKVDLAIRAGKLDDSSLRVRHLFNSYHKLVATPNYLAQYSVPKTVASLDQHTTIGYSDLKSLNEWFFSDGNTPYVATPQFTANNGEVIRRLCLESVGIACLSDFMVNDDISAGRLVELLPEKRLNIPLPFHAVYYSDQAVSLKIRVFIDFLLEKLNQQ